MTAALESVAAPAGIQRPERLDLATEGREGQSAKKWTMGPDGTWLTIDVTRERAGQGELEHPADGSSANLLEAVTRARAHEAYLRLLRAI